MKKQYNFREVNCLSQSFRPYSFVKLLIPFFVFLNVSLVLGQGNKDNSRVFTWDNTAFLDNIAKAPLERSPNAEAQAIELALPMLDGTTQNFKFLESPVMESGLVANWIPIKTYQGHSADLKTVVRLSVSKQFGVTVFLNTSGGMIAIEPLNVLTKNYRISRVTNEEGFECFTKDAEDVKAMALLTACGSHAGTRRDYLMAIAATGEYTNHRLGTAFVQADITNLINYLNTLYEVEMALHFNLVSGNNSIIYTDGATDPFTPSGGSSSAAASQAGFNTTAFTNVMPASNYDIGHTLHYRSSGDGYDGQAGPGPCNTGNKAAGWTQINGTATFNLPSFGGILGHEVGHQLGANHPFFGNASSCFGNRNPSTSYEPGSGSTYMSYNGVCSPQDVGSSRDLYFHNVNLNEMHTYLTGTGNSCAASTLTSNTAPVVNGNPNGLTFNIPTRTPFELTGTATDAEGNPLTYTWEEYDNDPASGGGAPNDAANTTNQPLFRSFSPTSSPTRIVPQLSNILANTQTQGEILPRVARTMKFRLTVRDRYTAGGVVLGGWACDDITLNVVDVGATGFALTSQNAATSWIANGTNTATITWDVAGTTAAPISCANVKILFSTDNGATFPYTLAASVPNNGSANVVIPSYPTFTGRVKVVCASGNIFFDINNAPITITSSCAAEAATVAPTTSVSALAGAGALNLGLTPQYGTSISPFAGSITASSATANLSYSRTWSSGTCGGPSNANKYESTTFQVNNSGTYNFSLTSGGDMVMNLYQTSYNAASVCTNWLASSTTQASSGNFLSIGTTLSYSLTPGTNYVLVVSSFSNAQPASLPAAFSVAISGAGSALNGIPNSGASFNYAYVVVNTATNNITSIQTNSDLSAAGTFPVGSYKVYGLSYINTTTLASLQSTYGGGAFTALQNALAGLTFCGDLSTNSVMVTVVPPCVLPTINAPTVTQPTCVLATGTIVVNATGSGTLEYSVDNGTNWTTFNTFANLVAGNYNIRVRLQSDPSCVATYASNPVVINPQPSIPTAPVVGAITNATCAVATGSVALSGLPATWTLTRSPGGVATSGTGATSTPSGLAVGTYTYTVTNTASGCVSPASASIGIAPYPTSLSSLAIAPATAVNAAAGAAALNLGLSPQYGTVQTSWMANVPASPTMRLTFNNSGCSAPYSNSPGYTTYTFQVGAVGNYTFSLGTGASAVMNLYQSSFNSASTCTNWLASSGIFNGVNVTTSSTMSFALNPGTTYVLVLSGFATGDPAFTRTVSFTSPVGGSVVTGGQPNPGASFNYAYVVVNTASNTVAAIQANSDLTALPGGTYAVHGLSYQNPTTLANLQTYVSGTFVAFQTALTAFTFCGNLSSNNVAVTITSTCTQPTITAPTVTQTTCASATGTIVVNATGSGTLEYSINNGGAWQPSSTFSSVAAGNYNIKVRLQSDPTCIATYVSNPVVITAQPATPSAPVVGTITQPTCTLPTGSVALSGLPSGTWTLTRSSGGATTTGTGTTTTISLLAAGTYTYTVSNTAGCTSVASGNVVIPTQPATPSAPSVGTITPPTCALATGSVELSGLQSSGSWTLTRSPGGATTTGTGTSTTISLLAAGTYTYTVSNTAGCTSGASGNVVIPVQPTTPSAPSVGTITPPTCAAPTGSVELSGLPSSGSWTLTRSPGGTTTTGTGAMTTVSSLPAGTYTYTVSNAAGCTSGASGNVAVPVAPGAPSAPVVGTITPPTCAVATGSVELSGLPSSGSWTLMRSPGGATTTGTGTTTTISLLAAGTYTYTVSDAAGCTSTASGDVVIPTQPATPTAPSVGTITPPTCAVATGSVELTGLPSSGSWTLTRSPGGATTTGTGITTTISLLSAGTYTYTVSNTAGCTSGASGDVVIPTQPTTPTAPSVGTITPPTCAVATGSVELSGLPSSGSWTLTRSPGGATTTGTGTSTTVSLLAAGTYTYTVSNAAGCTSGASGNVLIPAQPATPSAPSVGTITPPTCVLATGSVELTGLPSSGSWTLTRSPGGATTTGTGTTTTISLLAAGTYTYTVSNAAGCVSVASGNVVIPTQPATPSAPSVGTITLPTCAVPTGSVELSGLPSSGAWTLTRSPGGTTTTGTGTTGTVSSIPAGATYTYTVSNVAGCTSVASGNVLIPSVPGAPTAPSVGTITPPTCAVATGSVELSGLPSSGTWTLTRSSGGTTTTGTGTSTTISLLSAGTYTYTVSDAAGCTSGASGNVVIPTQPATPSAPSVGTITPPTCVLATGSVELTGLPSSGSWTLTRSPGGATTTGTGTTTTISLLAAGTYTYTVSNAAGCVSVASGNVVIPTQPATPSAPSVGTITPPTCALATGSVELSGLPSSGSWTLTRSPGGTTTTGTGTMGTVSSIPTGATYTYTVSNAAGCSSVASGNVVIPGVPGAPSAPSVGTITPPTCAVATGSVELSGLPSSGTWTLTRSPGGTTTTGTGTLTTISLLPAGTYTYTVSDAAGCTSGASGNVVIPTQPATPSAPSVGTITPPTCAVATGSVELTGLPSSGTWTLTRSPGGATTTGTGTSTTISLLAAGTYTYTVSNTAGCTSVASGNVVIPTQPATPSAPSVGTITQPTCAVQTGSVALSGLPSSGTWTLTRSPGGTTTTGTGTTGTVSSIPAGVTYTYTVSNVAGCSSVASGNVAVNAAPLVPTVAPITGTLTVTTCVGATTTLASATAGGTWMSASTSVATISATGVVTPVSPGTSLISYKVDNGSCATTVTTTVTVSACCPIFSAPAPAAIVVNNTCESFCGLGSAGTVLAPTTACPTGSTLQYSLDNFATAPLSAPPTYTGAPITISTRCSCDATPSIVSATTSVTTTPQYCPPALWISGGYATLSTCEGSTVKLTGSTVGGIWGTTNPLIATVSADGVVKGIKSGSVGITYSVARGICTYTVSTPITVVNCPCPVLTQAAPAAVIVNSSCGVGCVPVAGSISAPRTPCPSGSVLEYSVDGFRADSSKTIPVYGTTAVSISTRCRCESTRDTVSPITTVRTAPVACLPTCIPTLAVAGGLKRETGDAVSATVGLFTNGLSQGSFNGSTYNWSNLASGQSFSIRPSRNDNPLMGVTTLDMSLISRHILAFDKLNSPYKIIAADVNRDGEVDASDILLIRRLVLRIINEFPSNTAWRFVEKKYLFRDPTDPLAEDFPEIINLANLQTNVSNADFVAVKVGDVNYSATIVNGNPTNTSAELRGGKQVTLELTDQQLEKGTTYRIPLTVSSQARLTGLQFGLNWDKNKVENLRIEAGNLPNFNEGNTAMFGKEGIVTSAWAAAEGVSVAEPTTVFYLVVQPKFNTRLTEIFSKNDVYTEGVAYDAVSTRSAVNLRFLPAGKSDFQLMPNHPNPFTNQTVIPFLLPQDGQVTLTIYDLTGKLIFTKKETFAKGYNELLFKSEIDIPEGLYMYRLQTDTQMAERKMMIRR